MIEVKALCKRYGPLLAVKDLDFHVGKGSILGFIGPNGAGKTTTMRILTGYLPATSGDAWVAGFDVFESPMEVKRRVGYLPERPPLYPELSVGDYLYFVAEIRRVPARERYRRVGEVMELVGLSGWERRLLGSLSKGYRQRVGLAQALVHDPQVLILDEPTSGLDPGQTVGIRELLRDLGGDRTVILSTHILAEVEAACDHVVLINQGRIVASGSLEQVRHEATGGIVYGAELQGEDIIMAVAELEETTRVEPLPGDGAFQALKIWADSDPRPAIARLAANSGWQVRALEKITPSLEDAFLAIVGREPSAHRPGRSSR